VDPSTEIFSLSDLRVTNWQAAIDRPIASGERSGGAAGGVGVAPFAPQIAAAGLRHPHPMKQRKKPCAQRSTWVCSRSISPTFAATHQRSSGSDQCRGLRDLRLGPAYLPRGLAAREERDGPIRRPGHGPRILRHRAATARTSPRQGGRSGVGMSIGGGMAQQVASMTCPVRFARFPTESPLWQRDHRPMADSCGSPDSAMCRMARTWWSSAWASSGSACSRRTAPWARRSQADRSGHLGCAPREGAATRRRSCGQRKAPGCSQHHHRAVRQSKTCYEDAPMFTSSATGRLLMRIPASGTATRWI